MGITVQGINRRHLSAALLAGMKKRSPDQYYLEVKKLRRTAEGRDLLELSRHPERWELVIA